MHYSLNGSLMLVEEYTTNKQKQKPTTKKFAAQLGFDAILTEISERPATLLNKGRIKSIVKSIVQNELNPY